MGVLERDFARLKEKVEVLLGERGATGRRAVRLEEVTRTVDRAVTAVKTIGRVAWDNVTGKPETFPPTAHTHPITAVTGLEEALANKASSSHTHAWSAITGKPAEFPPESHTHDFDEITGTVTVAWANISGKPSAFPPEVHSHATSDVTGLDVALAGKADAGHTHAIEAIEGLTEAIESLNDLIDSFHPGILDDAYWNVNGTWRTDRSWNVE